MIVKIRTDTYKKKYKNISKKKKTERIKREQKNTRTRNTAERLMILFTVTLWTSIRGNVLLFFFFFFLSTSTNKTYKTYIEQFVRCTRQTVCIYKYKLTAGGRVVGLCVWKLLFCIIRENEK